MEDEKMPLTEHLGELRKRIVVSLVAVLAAFMVAFNYSEEIFKFIMFPLRYNLDFSVKNMYVHFVQQDKLQSTKLVFLAPAEAFWMNIKVSFVAGLMLSLPVLFHQLWKFISPGLLQKEKKYVFPFIFSATGLFLFGAAFCFFIVLPFAMGFLLTYKVGDFLMPMLSVGQYVDFCLKFILAFGAVFELPIFIIFLTKMGIVTPKTLARNRKYAVLIAFILAAFLTPTPDAFNQMLMALPIILLYEIGIWISPLFVKKKEHGGAD
ncbi:MAG: twin-arginine translocase subunit TatC [Nitrospirae bacterium]|jgi:sec-independent protein translocase protein TatC|nr:twin-arginine translocase subunit TatC [Nitrospirota bacterium]MCL5063199.1 twin-arginine translocase subunit TatC [Nitrospirota bacterium]MDA8215037.1 twin-arginine translocase subunit TatC [Nitrospiraceae bacterium]MDA8340461.1 twin-arginine translocase subunit TatC [Nitrospiraceae bacterium]